MGVPPTATGAVNNMADGYSLRLELASLRECEWITRPPEFVVPHQQGTVWQVKTTGDGAGWNLSYAIIDREEQQAGSMHIGWVSDGTNFGKITCASTYDIFYVNHFGPGRGDFVIIYSIERR